jgi:signal transduction histidine kinase
MSNSHFSMRQQKIELLAKLRSYTVLHFLVVIATASSILFIYYSYMYSLPSPPGNYMSWFWSFFYFEFRNHALGILLSIPMIYATITLGWKRSSIIILILLASIAPYIINFSYNAFAPLLSFVTLIVPPAIIIIIELKIILDAKEKSALAEKRRERAEYMRQLFSVQEDERKRISRGLHDGVIQTLLVNASLAHNILESKMINSDYIKSDLESIKKNNLDMMVEIRRICQNLRPSVLDNLGLISSIKWLIDKLHEETGIDVKFSLSGAIYELSQEKNVALFRIMQEAINNIQKHSEASMVSVSIIYSDTCMKVQIKDNGKGFTLTGNISKLALSAKLGIMGMNERAQSIGANLQIKSKIGSGTEINITIPRDDFNNESEQTLLT